MHHRHGDLVVLQPDGALDRSVVDELRSLALEAQAPVVVELHACLRFDADALRRPTEDWELFRPPMSLVCTLAGDVLR